MLISNLGRLKLSLVFFGAVMFLGLLVFGLQSSTEVGAEGTEDELSGWAWSENIGWVSLNCRNGGNCEGGQDAVDYKVMIDSSGNLSGYGWSSNIGWLSFNRTGSGGTGNPPQADIGNGSGAIARINGNGEIVGWARFLAGAQHSDGWDGWVSLSGSNYGVETLSEDDNVNNLSFYQDDPERFAWGHNVVGWLKFAVLGNDDPNDIPGLSVAWRSTRTLIPTGSTMPLTWEITSYEGDGGLSCEINGTGAGLWREFNNDFEEGEPIVYSELETGSSDTTSITFAEVGNFTFDILCEDIEGIEATDTRTIHIRNIGNPIIIEQ